MPKFVYNIDINRKLKNSRTNRSIVDYRDCVGFRGIIHTTDVVYPKIYPDTKRFFLSFIYNSLVFILVSVLNL